MNDKTFDIIIIGGGVAGISAALWCDELGLRSILLESKAELGGQLLWTYNAIENHLGIIAEDGKQLRDIFVRQIEKRNFTLRLNAKVTTIDVFNKLVSLGNDEIVYGKAIVIATGIRRRTADIEGVKRFENNGIIKSGKRDKYLVQGKNVLIVGGGDAALENSLILSETASKVYIAHRRKEFRARQEFIEQAKSRKNIEFLKETVVEKIEGIDKIESVELTDLNKQRTYKLPVDSIIFRIGVEPNTKALGQEIDFDEKGYIKINSFCETNVRGVFAIGDVANPISPTVSSAVGMGTTSVKAIYDWLN